MGRVAEPNPAPSSGALTMGFDRLDERVGVNGPKLKAAREAPSLKVTAQLVVRSLSSTGCRLAARPAASTKKVPLTPPRS